MFEKITYKFDQLLSTKIICYNICYLKYVCFSKYYNCNGCFAKLLE